MRACTFVFTASNIYRILCGQFLKLVSNLFHCDIERESSPATVAVVTTSQTRRSAYLLLGIEASAEMPGLNSAVYQITSWANLSPQLPNILKDYAKAAIRTDPVDLLQWSRDYFRGLSRGTTVPLDKDRWEDPSSPDNRSGITSGLLRLLHKQVGAINFFITTQFTAPRIKPHYIFLVLGERNPIRRKNTPPFVSLLALLNYRTLKCWAS